MNSGKVPMLAFSIAANKSGSFNFSKFGAILIFKKPLSKEKKRIGVINIQHSCFVGYVEGSMFLQKNMEASPRLGQQASFLLAHLAFPHASLQQV